MSRSVFLLFILSLITFIVEAQQQVNIIQPKSEIRIQEWGSFAIVPEISVNNVAYSNAMISIRQASGGPLVADMSYTKGVLSFYTKKGYAGKYDLTMNVTLTDAKSLVYQTFYNFSVIVEPLPLADNVDSVILQDDFLDEKINVADSKLVNGAEWKVVRGTVGNDMKLYMNNSLVVSENTLDFNDITIYFETYTAFYYVRGITFMYIDEDNYYEINLSTFPLQIARVMNGVRTVLLESATIGPLTGNLANYYGAFKVYISKENNVITIKYGKLGYSGDYCLTVVDKDTDAFNKFNTKSRFGFYEKTNSAPTLSRFRILNLKVTKGKRNEIRTPRTYFVDPINGSDNNNGITLQSSWKTLRRSQMVLLPGDTLNLANGIYRETFLINASTIAEQPITIRAIESGKAIIDGTEVLTNTAWTLFSTYPTIIYKYIIQRDVYSHVLSQNSMPLTIAMKPNPLNNNVYLNDNYLTVGAKDVFTSRYLASKDNELEYLNLHNMFRNNSNGEPVGDNYWNGATLYHYSPITDSTVTKKILSYSAALNQATVVLLKYQPTFSVNDKYAMAHHPGLISKPGEYAFTDQYLYMSPLNNVHPKDSTVETSSLQDGIIIDQAREGIILDGIIVQRFLGTGISCVKGCDDVTIVNVKSLSNMVNGLYIANTEGLYVRNSEFAYNTKNGFYLTQKTRNILIENSSFHDNALRGIFIGYSGILSFYCWNVAIKNNILKSHFNENLLIYGCTNVKLSENNFENNNTYNLVMERMGEINITRNIFANGSLSIINSAKPKFYNNNFINSGFRFALKFETSVRYSSFVSSSSFVYGGLTKIVEEIKTKSNPVANTLLWNKNPALVNLVSTTDINTNSAVVQDQIISFINSVISDLSFPSKHVDVIKALRGTARMYWDALIQRGLLNNNGNLLRINTSVEKEVEEIRGFTRSILDELALDGKLYKANTDFYPRGLLASNNIFINSEFIGPNSSYSITPYWNFTNNYFNIKVYNYNAWFPVIMNYGTNILKTTSVDLIYQFINPYQNNYNLLKNSTLIDAGLDVGMEYNGPAPDIGAFESNYKVLEGNNLLLQTLQFEVSALQNELLLLRNALSLFLNENTNRAIYDKGARIYKGTLKTDSTSNSPSTSFASVPCYELLIHSDPNVVPTSNCPMQYGYGNYLTISYPLSLKATKIVIKAKKRAETQCNSIVQLPDISLFTSYSVNDMVSVGVSRTFYTNGEGYYYQELRATDITKPFEGVYFHINTDGSSNLQKADCFDLMKVEMY
ncbi:hypothetical protein ABK040_008776 [Willaertia magna]